MSEYFCLQSIRHALHTYFLPLAKIHELYIVNVEELVAEFFNVARHQVPEESPTSSQDECISIKRDPYYRRLKSTVDIPLAVKLYNVYRCVNIEKTQNT